MQCGSLIGAIRMIFDDLHDVPVNGSSEEEENATNILYKIKSFIIKNIYDFYVKGALIGIFALGITESRKHLRNSSLANSLTVVYTAFILACVVPLSMSFWKSFSS